MSIIDLFEKDLVNKLNFKASSKISSDSLLFKTFKFFDLNNVGTVPRSEFFRAISKAGVVISSPQDMDTIFEYYDKQGEGKIDYRQFIDQVLFKPQEEEEPMRKSTKQLIEQKLSQSSLMVDAPHIHSSPITKTKAAQTKQSASKQLNTAEDVVNFIRDKLKEEGIDSLLDRAVKLKNLDTTRSHKLTLAKVAQVFPYVSRDQLGVALQPLNSYQNGEVNYAELIYYLRDKLNPQRTTLISNTFDHLDIRKQGEVLIEEVLAKNEDRHRIRQFQKAVEDYCRFQGIDDGVFTDEDFLDFFGFVSLPFNEEDFRLYVSSAYPEEQRRSSKSSRSRRQFEGSRKDYQKQQQPLTGNFIKKTSQNPLRHEIPTPEKSSSGLARSDFKNQDVKSKTSKGTSRISSLSKSIEMILNRVSKRLSSKGPKGFLTFEKSLRAADLDQDSLISLQQLKKVVRDQRIDISETECHLIFEVFDQQQTGLMNYLELLQVVKGQVPEARKKLIARVWDKVKETEDITSYNKLRSSFQVRQHPDIKNAKRYEEQILKEFYETIMLVQDLNGVRSEEISRPDFEEYLENVSYSIPDDSLFETTLIAVWKLGNESRIQDQYAGSRKHFQSGKSMYLQDHHRYLVQGGTVSQNAPFGTYNEPTNYSTQSRRFDQQN